MNLLDSKKLMIFLKHAFQSIAIKLIKLKFLA